MDVVADEIAGAPEEMPEQGGDTAGMEGEVAVVFVEEIDAGGEEAQGKKAHVPVRLARLDEDAVEKNAVGAKVEADAIAVNLE